VKKEKGAALFAPASRFFAPLFFFFFFFFSVAAPLFV
jgi:hypothetical protein